MLNRRSLILGSSAAVTLFFSSGEAPAADDFPNRPITIIVPYAAGGSSDTLVRLVGVEVSEGVKQSVIIDNRGGGGGAIAAFAVKQAAPDGYTLLLGHSGTHVFTPVLFPNSIRYDPLNDFAMITPLISFPTILLVPADHPAKSVEELVRLARSKPGGLTYASQGVGNTAHIIGEMFRVRANIPLVHVPYKGGNPALTDLIAGRVDMMFSSYLSSGAHVEAGKLRMLALAAEQRSPHLPELPTMAEAGVPAVGIDTWFGIMAPKHTPDTIISTLHREFVNAAKSNRVRDHVLPTGADIIPMPPEEFAKKIASDIERVRQIAREAHII